MFHLCQDKIEINFHSNEVGVTLFRNDSGISISIGDTLCPFFYFSPFKICVYPSIWKIVKIQSIVAFGHKRVAGVFVIDVLESPFIKVDRLWMA